jgi:hypothetical protein
MPKKQHSPLGDAARKAAALLDTTAQAVAGLYEE